VTHHILVQQAVVIVHDADSESGHRVPHIGDLDTGHLRTHRQHDLLTRQQLAVESVEKRRPEGRRTGHLQRGLGHAVDQRHGLTPQAIALEGGQEVPGHLGRDGLGAVQQGLDT